jgi:hypothetical protein
VYNIYTIYHTYPHSFFKRFFFKEWVLMHLNHMWTVFLDADRGNIYTTRSIRRFVNSSICHYPPRSVIPFDTTRNQQ